MKSAFFIRKAIDQGAAFSTNQYPLKNSAILDSGTTTHIFNEITRFLNFRAADPGDFVWAGKHKVPIQGYGNVDIEIRNPKGIRKILRLYDVAFCQDFASNLVSLRQLRKRGIWWDNRPGYNHLRRTNFSVIAVLEDHYDQFVLEYIPEEIPRAAFHARRNKFNSWTKRAPSYGDTIKWHLRLGHPGPKALEHLVNCSQGARIRGLTTVECDACGQSKAKRQIRRAPKDLHEGPGYRLAIDFHDFKPGMGFTSLMLVTDRWSGLVWEYYMSNRKAETIITALRHLFGMLKRHHEIEPKVVEADNEITIIKPEVKAYLTNEEKVIIEPSAPYTNSQIGGAERSGGVIKSKIRTIAIASKLPEELWPEMSRAAVYLHNRTPNYTYNWKSPYDRFHTHVAHRDGVVVEDRKPQLAHLKVYGCKAFAMTTDALRKSNRLHTRLNPKAWIGYLVGYDSTNIYRIWNPAVNKVFRTRDVVFNEDIIYDGKKQDPEIGLDELERIITSLESTSEDEEIAEANQPFQIVIPSFAGDLDEYESIEDQPDEVSVEDLDDTVENLEDAAVKAFENPESFYPTPDTSPPAALLAGTIRETSERKVDNILNFESWKASFYAGTLVSKNAAQRSTRKKRIRTITNDKRAINKARLKRLLAQPDGIKNIHRRELPPEPRRHDDLDDHILGEEFRKAERDHLQSHVPMKSWTETFKKDPEVKGHQILDCMWVYVYKFDKHGRLAKCKARLVVRGDQQSKSAIGDTYAATLAARSFRVFMAIAARFDLEMIQYDAVNAFVHAKLDEKVFMRMPDGYKKPGVILKLNKALYGLRKSPLLWQKAFYSSLLEIGFKAVPHEPCCLTYEGIIIFFYVDDIVVAYKKGLKETAHKLITELKKKYNIEGGNELQWFLGIRVLRDRETKRLWLSQASYIDKIANLATSSQPDNTPMAREEPMPYEDRASHHDINLYQQKIGSLLYAAVTTRPDIAFATSRLSRFLTNPGPKHHAAADRVLLYLKRYRDYGLQFGGGQEDNFTVASDASFADNSLDRKSSQAYAMKLFGSLIGWRANKQDTVTTSTTEAELLALSQAAKEGQYISRLLRELTVRLDDHSIEIQCDNTQTIRLVNEEITRLQTKLRHVDIHNHWLRQEVLQKKIRVMHTKSRDMIADGLTKALSNEDFVRFRDHMGLIDIGERINDLQTGENRPQYEDLFDDST